MALLLLPVAALVLLRTAAGIPIPLTVACAANASAPERFAAVELASYLRSIVSDATPVDLVNATHATAATAQLAVGYSAARLIGTPVANFQGLGKEGYVLLPSGGSLALSGEDGSPRGTLYAVNEFLEALGVRFPAPDVTVLPKELPSSLPTLRARYVPKLEYRQTFGFEVLTSADFNVHLRLNKAHLNIPAPELDKAHGGVYPTYAKQGQAAGATHTSYSLLDGLDRGLAGPPPDLFKSHRVGHASRILLLFLLLLLHLLLLLSSEHVSMVNTLTPRANVCFVAGRWCGAGLVLAPGR